MHSITMMIPSLELSKIARCTKETTSSFCLWFKLWAGDREWQGLCRLAQWKKNLHLISIERSPHLFPPGHKLDYLGPMEGALGIKVQRQTWGKPTMRLLLGSPAPSHPTHPLLLFTARWSRKSKWESSFKVIVGGDNPFSAHSPLFLSAYFGCTSWIRV